MPAPRSTSPRLAPLALAGREPAGGPSPAAYAARIAGAAPLLATAREDRALQAELMRMPALERIAAASSDRRFHRQTLVRLLALEVEAALDDPAVDPRPAAELGAALAAALPRDVQGRARRAAAWAWWLFGKSLLRASQWRLARSSFEAMHAFIPRPLEPSEEEALSAVGLAQVWEGTGEVVAAEAQFLLAAYLYSKLDTATGSASCLAQLGFLLYESGRLEDALPPLRTAIGLLDPAFAPSLAARLWLALAEIETTLDDGGAAAESLHRARALYRLAPSAAEDLDRIWREARIALAAGADGRAEASLDRVRRELLARGSLSEAARCTYEQLLIRLEARRFEAAGELTAALAGAFPAAAREVLAKMTALTRLAAAETSEGEGFYGWSLNLRQRLRQQPPRSPDRLPVLRSTQALADRLLRHRGELEDPIGAALDA
jgi:tetratricopeptide (TPR) repeat protein